MLCTPAAGNESHRFLVFIGRGRDIIICTGPLRLAGLPIVCEKRTVVMMHTHEKKIPGTSMPRTVEQFFRLLGKQRYGVNNDSSRPTHSIVYLLRGVRYGTCHKA